MWEIIGWKVLPWLLEHLPVMLVRFFVKPAHIAKDLEVDLRSVNPLNIYLASEVPRFDIWLRITNKSGLAVLVDRVVIEVWIAQPFIHGAYLHRRLIQPKETHEDIFFQSELSEIQRETILNRLQMGRRKDRLDNVTLNMNLYCDSRIGSFDLRITKERYDVPVEGIPVGS